MPGQPHLRQARGATVRRDLIAVAARTARHGHGHLTVHLPAGWHREHEWASLFHAVTGPPATAACPAQTRSPHPTAQRPSTPASPHPA
jgi:hypothetical protein